MSDRLLDITIFLFLFWPICVFSQINQKNYFSKVIYVENNSFSIDSISIDKSSILVMDKNGNIIDKSFYKIDPVTATFTPLKIINDSLTISYRTFQFNFNKTFKYRDSSVIIADSSVNFKPIRFSALPENRDLFGMGGLNKSGSISRGAYFGNNQNLSLNSNLNLQVSGKISENISIAASITDNNIPIQPQGNTQQLQDFDQVYIQLFSNSWKLTAGDFWIKKPKGYFLNYTKRGQGATYELEKKSGLFSLKNQFSAAISKGKFSRNVIQGIEGNLGPYRLKGAENEPFIIVLSGTENVYIDGILLTRGQENDYTIDYNTSEITFTTNHLITKDKRIVVEFQYSDKNYARSLFQNSTVFSNDKWSFFLNVYAEQDSKNQPIQQELSPEERNLLENIGDQTSDALIQSTDSITFSNELLLYKKIDSLGFEIYQYSNSPDSAFYQLVFSDLGEGGGDYILSEYSALGRIYSWVSPTVINGDTIHNGNFAPLRLLITPKKRQMVTTGIERRYGKNSLAKFEAALSNEDVNTFSQIGNNDNLGLAGKFLWKHHFNPIKNWNINTTVDFEGLSSNFKRIERFRAVEFERNWNTQNISIQGNQYATSAGLTLNNKYNKIEYKLNSFIIDTAYNGIKNDFKMDWTEKINANIDFSYLTTNGIQKTSFLRHMARIYKSFEKFKIGFEDIHEHNLFYENDTLNGLSYQFYDWKIYLQQGDSSKNSFKIYYQERYDWFNSSNSLVKSTSAKSPGISYSLKNRPNQQLKLSVAYRMLSILDTSLTNINPENSLTNRVDYQFKLLKGMIHSTTYFEIGSGLELQKEFIFLEVPAGQGVYTWVDYNNDNVKDLSEFEIAQFQDQATYIRVFTPSNTYTKVYSYQMSEVLNVNPRYLLKSRSKINSFINKFNTQTAIRSEKKTSTFNFSELINPFKNNIGDTLLQSLSNSIRNSIFFNRSDPKFGVEYTFQQFNSKLLLLNGFDSREKTSNELKLRWNLNKFLSLTANTENTLKYNSSDYAPTRNFLLSIAKYQSKFAYQPSTKFRVSISGCYSEKQNQIEYGGEEAYLTDLGIELRYNQLKKGSFTGNLNLININYLGENNTSVAFEMLEALQPGRNSTWTIYYQRTMANNLQLTLNYNGRKSKDVSTIHAGGVQLRAFF
tara:strand:+ start:587 stop:4027 length:3441 start_codon:yes stop_codon:yes gene_type:complete